MTDYNVTPDELKTLAMFQSDEAPSDVDTEHLAKLLSLALLIQPKAATSSATLVAPCSLQMALRTRRTLKVRAGSELRGEAIKGRTTKTETRQAFA